MSTDVHDLDKQDHGEGLLRSCARCAGAPPEASSGAPASSSHRAHERSERGSEPLYSVPEHPGARCRERIYERAQKLLRNPEDVEDVVQEVCMRCLIEQRRLHTGTHFRTWLHRAIMSACKAAQQRHRVAVLSAESASSREALELAFQAAQVASNGGEAERVVENVRAALQQLNPRQRRLLEWRYLEGESFAQIAERLGIAERSARPAVHHAGQAFGQAYAAVAREGG